MQPPPPLHARSSRSPEVRDRSPSLSHPLQQTPSSFFHFHFPLQQGGYKFHQYTVVGRHLPTAADPEPTLFRMRLWATDDARARSKFWYFLAKLRKVKKANGQIVACNEIFEKRPTTVKNFGIWVRYQSRTGSHNM